MSETPIDGSRRRAALAMRALNDAFVGHEADPSVHDEIEAMARELTERLRTGERRDRAAMLAPHVARMFHDGPVARPERAGANPMTDRAVGGETNPTAVDLQVRYEHDEVIVITTLGAAFEGAPGRAHGGMVAAVFDDVTGYVLPLVGAAAYTGELTVRYRRPTPVGVPLEIRCRLDGREGRKVRISGECRTSDGEVVATVAALYITVERFGVTT